jgi:hypothetical protein
MTRDGDSDPPPVVPVASDRDRPKAAVESRAYPVAAKTI